MDKIEFVIISFANRKYGLGHFSRSQKIYKYIQKKNNITFINNKKNDAFFSYDSKFYEKKLITKISKSKKICLLIDLPKKIYDLKFKKLLIKYNFFKSVSRKVVVVLIDNYKSDLSNIQFAWIPSFYVNKNYKNNNKIYYGWDKYLLPNKLKIQRKVSKEQLTLVILLGGSDINSLSNYLPKMIDKNIKKKLNIKWIVGPFSKKPILEKNSIHNWKIFKSPTKIQQIIATSDIGFSIYGVSFFELLNQNIPTVTFCKINRENKDEISALERLNIALVSKEIKDITQNISKLINSKNDRKFYKRKTLKIFKNQGIKVLYDNIKKIL